ncbi:efflux RND transporter periplasmic adaptor subunit [Paraburkholderia silvatlantica]|nr:efflux RND transporter periplasmic adaptor subunit [Paraburkholderia silvatlantica]
MVGRRSVRLGAYVTAGTPMLAAVPLQKAYVVANFQETQLTSVRRGQTADTHVDTFPGAVLHGTRPNPPGRARPAMIAPNGT